MNTTRLTKTNLISPERAAIIESIIGIEITDVITQRKSSGISITPYDTYYAIGRRLPYYRVKNVSFNHKTGVLIYSYRNKWQRGWTNVRGQGQPVGYKLPTTNIPEGFVWGNFIFCENKCSR